MSRNRRPSASEFFRKIRLFVLVLAVFCAIVFAAEYVVLKNFQSKYDSPKNAGSEVWTESQKAFEEYVASLRAGDWADMWFEKDPDSMDSREAVKDIMEERLCSGGTSYLRAADYTEDRPVYLISGPEGPLADVSLEKTADGEWNVKSVNFRFSGEYDAEIEVPAGCPVYCNGTLLDERFRGEGKDNFYIKEYIEDIDNRVMWYTWKVSGQLTLPELTFEAPDGKEFYTNDLGLLTVCLPEGEMQELYDLADRFFDAFHRYVMYGYFSDETYARMAAANTVPDSQAYRSVYDAYDAIKHAPCYGAYENELTLSPVICWGDNAYSIDIKYRTDARHIAEVTEFDGIYRLYFLDLGEGYGIYGLQMQ